jgi:phosphocarrier protein
MVETTVCVCNTLGLHARAAAHLVRLANLYSSSIIIERKDNGTNANAKSILSVLSLAASHGVELHIVADGSDEAAAIKAIEELFLSKFGEDQ